MSYARMATISNNVKQKTSTTYCCEICNYITVRRSNYNSHLLTAKHKSATAINNIKQKTSPTYCCEICDYITVRKSNYNSHLLSVKHKTATNGNTTSNTHTCEICNKIYKDRTGLWRHKQICVSNSVVKPIEVSEKDELIMTLLKQNTEQNRMNAELHAKVIELCKNGIMNNSNNTTNHNKTFNLQIFLNETCKDAVNLEDFAKAVVLQLSDLDKIGEIGFVDGMTNIIETRLKSLDVNKRPIHCTDAKREVFYVKDNDKWGKDKNNEKMRRLILRMDRKLAPLLMAFDQNHKNKGYANDYEDIKHQQMKCEILGGADDTKNADAIIRRISKKILIDKCE
jgi:hypothetical protein